MINHYTSYSYNKIRSQCILSVSVRTSYVDVHVYKTDGKGNVENILYFVLFKLTVIFLIKKNLFYFVHLNKEDETK